jgi:UDPglucose--hexose-1-phosphate uridylyltransferase
MNEMRRDPITRKWVIIDTHITTESVVESLRAAVVKDAERFSKDPCTFCPGKEDSLPPPILELVNGQFAYRSHSPEWKIRALPDRNPVFRIEGNLNRRLVSNYDVMDGVGAHEVIIEHRNHVDWDEIELSEVAEIVASYRERMNDLSRDERFGHIFLFKNFGPSSGSSIPHPHATLIASPSVPERIRRELDSTRRHYQMKERCLFCDIIGEETRQRNHVSRVVSTYENFITISPFFASHPFETWILPRKHSSNFRALDEGLFSELALALQENLIRIKGIVGPLSYTLLLFTQPNKVWGAERDYWSTINQDYHWHFKFFPRFPRQKGFHRSFSAGSGYMVNQIAPEVAAELLRAAPVTRS